MSHTNSQKSSAKKTVTDLLEMHARGEKIVAITAYDATLAALMDESSPDILMIGDSLGMVVQGRPTTLGVTLDDMIYHCRAVQRAEPRAHVVCDMPFLSYQVSPEDAVRSAGRLIQEGHAESVKLEGGRTIAASVRRIVDAGIPVMGHVGLTPQSVHRLGGFKVQGKTETEALRLLDDARCLEEAGVYSMVIEGVPAHVAQEITSAVRVPTIGIGAGPHTGGQVLVCYDLLGLFRGFRPKFVKRYAELGDEVVRATAVFCDEVRRGEFPQQEHSFGAASSSSGAPKEP